MDTGLRIQTPSIAMAQLEKLGDCDCSHCHIPCLRDLARSKLEICGLGIAAWSVYGLLCVLSAIPEKDTQNLEGTENQTTESLASINNL